MASSPSTFLQTSLLTLSIFSIFITINADSSNWYSATKPLPKKEEKVTHLQFYFHDIMTGNNPTAVQIAGPDESFGAFAVADNPLTEGPDPASKLIGRAQGIYSNADHSNTSLFIAMSYSFVDGKFNGSSLEIMGKNAIVRPVREIAIVGGTGAFRFARGYAILRTVSYEVKRGAANVGYNVTVFHY